MNIVEMKHKYGNDLIKGIFANRGVKDIDLFLNPTSDNDTHVFDLPNIMQGIDLIRDNINKKILLLVDSDADGYTSAAIMYKTLKFINEDADIDFFVHRIKGHGLTNEFMDYVRETEPDLIIITDAGTNDIVEREEICKKGIGLLIIDHHKEDNYGYTDGVLINNHANYPKNEINKNLTGAGMTFLFCRALDDLILETGQVEELKDLAMVGLIGDNASLNDNETRFLCMNGINNVQSEMIKHVSYSNGKNENDLTFKDMSWGGIIPLINGITRIGTLEERKTMFKALADIDTDRTEIVQKRKLNKDTRKYEKIDVEMNAYELAVECAKKCKDRQKKIIDKETKNCDEQFNSEAGIQVYIIQNEDSKGITGLLANKLVDKWQQPVLCFMDLGDKYLGSLRGYEKSIPNLKKWCEDTGLFLLVQGHNNAAGIEIIKENLDDLIEETKNVEYTEFTHYVDKLYNEDVNVNDVFLVDSNKKDLAGLNTPMFGVKNLRITDSNCAWSKNTLRMFSGGLTYIKFSTPEEEWKSLIEHNGVIDVVGEFDINEWNGKKYPQFRVKEYELIKKENKPRDYGIFG